MKRFESYDMVILLMAVALTCFGVVMVYSAGCGVGAGLRRAETPAIQRHTT